MLTSDVARAANPIITDQYTADPSARVFDVVLYLYPSHDRDDAKWWDMDDWHVFSSHDLKTFTDHGVALRLSDIGWAKQYAWAPDCVRRNGTYYFYFPVDQHSIGVATSDRPTGLRKNWRCVRITSSTRISESTDSRNPPVRN